jgi:hypothetical protein
MGYPDFKNLTAAFEVLTATKVLGRKITVTMASVNIEILSFRACVAISLFSR